MRPRLICVLLLVTIFQCQCSFESNRAYNNKKKPLFDTYLEYSIQDIRAKFGAPRYAESKQSGSINSPLDKRIASMLGNDVNVTVYSYISDLCIMHFWFARNESGEWTVIGDVIQPKGIDF